MYDNDATLDEIAKAVGVTRERIRQIVKPHRPTRTEVPRRVPGPPPITPADVAAAIRASLAGARPKNYSPMRHLLESFVPTPMLAPHPTQNTTVPLDQWKAAWADRLRRAAAAQGEPLSRPRYEVWASVHGEPKAQSSVLRGMLWTEVCAMAGVMPAATVQGPRSDRYWDVDRCHAVLDEFTEWALRHNMQPSQGSYPVWSRGRYAPSWPLVRLRLGGQRRTYLVARTVQLLNEHFADALARLDAGEMVDPTTYIGPLNSPSARDETPVA